MNSTSFRCTAHRAYGFTLIELMTVVSIVAILAAVAMPSFRSILLNQRLASSTSDFVAALGASRGEAIKLSQTVNVAAVDGDWSNGWNIVAGTSTAPETIRSFDRLPQGVMVDKSSGNGFSQLVSYDSNGFSRNASGGFGAGCLTFKAETSRRVSIILSAAGRPKTCDPDKSGDCGAGQCK